MVCGSGEKVSPIAGQNALSVAFKLEHSSIMSYVSAFKIASTVEEVWGLWGDLGLLWFTILSSAESIS